MLRNKTAQLWFYFATSKLSELASLADSSRFIVTTRYLRCIKTKGPDVGHWSDLEWKRKLKFAYIPL